jgi:hypothetical protein
MGTRISTPQGNSYSYIASSQEFRKCKYTLMDGELLWGGHRFEQFKRRVYLLKSEERGSLSRSSRFPYIFIQGIHLPKQANMLKWNGSSMVELCEQL